jgi:hypothetical protein
VAGIGEVVEHTKAAINAVDVARQSVRTACERLTATLESLNPLLADAPELRPVVARHTQARDVLAAQLDVLDRAVGKL